VAPNVFHLEWPREGDQWRQDGMAQQWDAIRDVRSQTYKVLEAARAHKYVRPVSCSCVFAASCHRFMCVSPVRRR
jgi:hypothetical protein